MIQKKKKTVFYERKKLSGWSNWCVCVCLELFYVFECPWHFKIPCNNECVNLSSGVNNLISLGKSKLCAVFREREKNEINTRAKFTHIVPDATNTYIQTLNIDLLFFLFIYLIVIACGCSFLSSLSFALLYHFTFNCIDSKYLLVIFVCCVWFSQIP